MLDFTLKRHNDTLITIAFDGNLGVGVEPTLTSVAQAVGKSRVILDCEGIDTVNSMGALAWINFIKQLGKRTIYELHRLPIAMVDTANMLPGFTGNGAVVSFYAPFHCAPCRRTFEALVDTLPFMAKHAFPKVLCTKCASQASPEVEVEQYGGFLAFLSQRAGSGA